jgi:glycosyltransferase involved in cell wall biosynthesis
MLFSVIICTYKRAELLAQALESVIRQDFPVDDFEVIVVDNASTDQTKVVVDGFCERCPNVHYITEGEIGLSHARNRAWKEARGEFLVYLDDDVILPVSYLQIAEQVIKAHQPSIFGGPIYPFYSSQKPAWFKDEYTKVEVTQQPRELREDEYLNGGNFVIQPGVLSSSGGFSVDLGMRGNVLAYGEETALIRWVRVNRPEMLIYYEPRLFLFHLVREEKLKLSYWVKDRFARGRYSFLTFNEGEHTINMRHILGLLALPLIITMQATIGVLLRDRKSFPHYQNYYFERVFYQVVLLGKLTERLRRILGIR